MSCTDCCPKTKHYSLPQSYLNDSQMRKGTWGMFYPNSYSSVAPPGYYEKLKCPPVKEGFTVNPVYMNSIKGFVEPTNEIISSFINPGTGEPKEGFTIGAQYFNDIKGFKEPNKEIISSFINPGTGEPPMDANGVENFTPPYNLPAMAGPDVYNDDEYGGDIDPAEIMAKYEDVITEDFSPTPEFFHDIQYNSYALSPRRAYQTSKIKKGGELYVPAKSYKRNERVREGNIKSHLEEGGNGGETKEGFSNDATFFNTGNRRNHYRYLAWPPYKSPYPQLSKGSQTVGPRQKYYCSGDC
jgi:hypothetical protein